MAHQIAIESFQKPSKLYKTWKNAKRVIDSLEDGKYRWSICCNEFGQFFPHITMRTIECDLDFHYFISKGCCVTAQQ